MKSIFEYICENSNKHVVQNVIKEFLNNIDSLSDIKKQHFLARLSLCDVPEAKELKLDTNIDDIINMAKEVVGLIKDKKYKKVMNKYVIEPYEGISKEKDAILNWLTKFEDEKILKYFAIGYLSDRLYIIERTNVVDKIDFWEDIYDIYEDIDDLVKFHNEDEIDCKNNCGTLYVNWMGNAYYVLSSKKLQFKKQINIDDWRKTRNIYVSKKFNSTNIYGVTHSIINGSHFYTQKLDYDEFEKELDYINDFLKAEKENNYKSDWVTLDLLCECSLCLKLSKNNKYDEWKNTNKYLCSLIDKKTNILQSNHRKKTDKIYNLEKNEHCNILFILLNTIKIK